MTITLSQFRERFRRRAKDTENYRWSDELVDDAINDGLRAFGDYSGVVAEHTWTSGADDTYSFTLPDGFQRLLKLPLRIGVTDNDTILFSDSERLGEIRHGVGDAHYDSDDASAPTGYEIIGNALVIPDGVDSGEELKIEYEKLWPQVEADDDVLDLPYWAEMALMHYCHYYCLMVEGTMFSTEVFWKTNLDSRPVQNPAFEGCDWFLKQFEMICQKHIRQEVI